MFDIEAKIGIAKGDSDYSSSDTGDWQAFTTWLHGKVILKIA